MPEDKPPVLLILPSFMRSREQVHSALSEILQIEDFLYKSKVRKPGQKMSLPKTTAELDKFAEVNKRNILNHGHRIELARFLRAIYKHAPVIKVALPLNISPEVVDKTVNWFRTNVHAQTLMLFTYQNNLYGGMIFRIRHKTYDFSLNGQFQKAQDTLKSSFNLSRSSTALPPLTSQGRTG